MAGSPFERLLLHWDKGPGYRALPVATDEYKWLQSSVGGLSGMLKDSELSGLLLFKLIRRAPSASKSSRVSDLGTLLASIRLRIPITTDLPSGYSTAARHTRQPHLLCDFTKGQLSPMLMTQANQAPSKCICVIGAGPAGLAALKYLSQTSYFKTGSWKVVAYESRSKVGGIWFARSTINSS